MNDQPDRLSQLIQKAIQEEVGIIVEDEAKQAANRTIARVRAKTAEITATVVQRCTFERYGDSLKIIVDFEGVNKP